MALPPAAGCPLSCCLSRSDTRSAVRAQPRCRLVTDRMARISVPSGWSATKTCGRG
jgi:hypothetical protein